MSIYGDRCRLVEQPGTGTLNPTNSLIDIQQEAARWCIFLRRLRRADGSPLTTTLAARRYLAIIELGHAGRSDTIEVDWPIAGGTLALLASSLRVTANWERSSLHATVEAPDVEFTAWAIDAGSGPPQTIYPRTRTIDITSPLVPANVQTFQIPNYGRAYYLMARDTAAGAATSVTVRWLNASGITVRAEQWDLTPTVPGPGMRCGPTQAAGVSPPVRYLDVPAEAQRVQVEANAGVNVLDAAIVFNLDVG